MQYRRCDLLLSGTLACSGRAWFSNLRARLVVCVLLCATAPTWQQLTAVPVDGSRVAVVRLGWPARGRPRPRCRRPVCAQPFADSRCGSVKLDGCCSQGCWRASQLNNALCEAPCQDTMVERQAPTASILLRRSGSNRQLRRIRAPAKTLKAKARLFHPHREPRR